MVCSFCRGVLPGILLLAAPVEEGFAQSIRRPAAPVYDVVALRVEFQPDTTRFTTGDGTFGGTLFDTLAASIDPLPHDAAYFQAHLDFLSDYVARVSDGRTQVVSHLLPEVVRVSREMGAYSPIGLEADSDPERARLAALVAEAWTLADAQVDFDASGFDPATTAFVLFHAGVGRDIELIGTTLDKTPMDLPSLFFDAPTLDRLVGTPIRFKGLDVDRSLLLPRTESRTGFDFIADEAFLLEFSINGLLAASFFNYLGVPDLFDTASGLSAIGPFGLMDPLGLFAYNGLFPPEPSAWTKYYLGWVEPATLTGDGPEAATLRAASLPEATDIVRVPVSQAEYFLVENRYRDPEEDGLVLRVFKDGAVTEQRVENGDETFNGVNLEGFIGGVVVGVDNYDWALPGGVDEDGNPLNGGVLIWHIDERRLADGLDANAVNADPERRAVDLEEADGAQDIGFPSGSPFGPQADLGTPFDFFYEGNPVVAITQSSQEVRLYQNRFGPDTYPNSHTNDGGPSFVVVDGFSAGGATMTFTYRREAEGGLRPLPEPASLPSGAFRAGDFVTRLGGADATTLAYRLADSLLVVAPADGGPATRVAAEGLLAPVVATDGDALTLAPGEPGTPSLLRVRADGTTVTAALVLPAGVEPGGPDDQLVYDPASETLLALLGGGARTAVVRIDPAGAVLGEVTATALGTPVSVAVTDDGRAVLAGTEGIEVGDGAVRWSYTPAAGSRPGRAVFGRDDAGLVGSMTDVENGMVYWFLAGGDVATIDAAAWSDGAAVSAYPVLADLDDDGRLDVLVGVGRRLMAWTQGGAVVDGFPVPLAAEGVGQPLVARLTESGAWSVVTANAEGAIEARDLGARGRSVPGFPLAVGARLNGTPLLQGDLLVAVDSEGGLQGWRLDAAPEVWWGHFQGDRFRSGFVAASEGGAPEGPAAALLDARETYNWPNPIRDGATYLRFLPSRDVRVRITIINEAGTLVDEIVIEEARAGVPTEYFWQTDAGSGIYFARITATDDTGRSATELVKMAIVR